MRSDWMTLGLGDLCTFQSGHAFKPLYQGKSLGVYPFIKVSDMNADGNEICIRNAQNWVDDADVSAMGAKPCPAGATVFAKIGVALTSNRRRRLVRDTIIDNNMLAAIAKPHLVDELYLYYWLQTLDMNTIAAGTALPYLRVSDLKALPACVPPIEEQRAIASVLSAFDDKIELNRKLSETLDEMARVLCESWFVTGASPEWEQGTLARVAKVSSGKRPGARVPIRDEEHAIPLYGGAGVMAFCENALFDEPVIVTGRVGTLGVVMRTTGRCWPSDNTLVVEPTRPEWFFYVWLAMRRMDLAGLNRGSTQPLLSQSDLKAQNVTLPPGEAVSSFDRLARVLYGRADTAARESDTLASIRDALLPCLLSGELRISDAEKVVEEVV